ncbi:MAG: sugar ABC transporter ATP-binding protein [Pseudoclavibacter sp.]
MRAANLVSEPAPLLAVKNVSKTFGKRTVLRDVDLTIRAGEVHGLLGANGSGKSTLIKILAGFHRPDAGATVTIDGQEHEFPLRAADGVALSFVHQDLALVGDATITENLRLGRYETGFAWSVSWRSERRRVAESLRRFGINAGPDTLAGDLRPVEQALVAILRALEELRAHKGGILVLDEPTAYLPRDGVGRLFDAVREVAALGFGVLFVSHRLDEVRALTDRVSVLRDGALVSSEKTESLTERDMVSAIVGFQLDELYPQAEPRPVTEQVLDVSSLHGKVVTDVSLELRRGEIVGITGLVGMGWEEVPYLLFGAERPSRGSIAINGSPHEAASGLTPRRALSRGLALLPADRRRDSGLASASATENLTLATLTRYFISGRLRVRAERQHAEQRMREFQVSPLAPDASLGTFSGGNQQKVLMAKWLEATPDALMLHEPTQGVDVGARKHIFRRIQRAASDGVAVLLATAEYEDLAHLCDRVLVFRHGRISAELEGAMLTQDRIANACYRDTAAA